MPASTLFSALRTPCQRLAQRLGGPCLVCRSWCADGFCADCVARFAAPPHRCLTCAVEVPGAVQRCGACLRAPPPQCRTVAALSYVFPWDGLVQRFKYHQTPELAAPLSRALCAAVQAAGPGAVALLVPVPIAAAKLRARGYNQAWELARRVGPSLGVPTRAAVLQRLADGPAQQGGSREQRWQQVRDAFAVAPPEAREVVGREVALLDDVMTTGATAAAAAHALLRAGAASVQVWVLARTPAVHDTRP